MNWISTSIGELVVSGTLEFGDGYRTKRSEHGRPGYRIIRVADVANNDISFDGPDFVAEDFGSAIGSKAGRSGDILLTTKGTVGRVAVMPDTTERVVYSPQLCYFRVHKSHKINPRFLRFWFSSPEFWNQAADRMNNTDMAAYINMADVRSLKISLPDIEAQQAIAEVLGALDDKIAANTKLAATAAQLAHGVFAKAIRESSDEFVLSEITELLSRGITPKYSEGDDTMLILNQKCVRGQRVDLEPARRTLLTKVREDKILKVNDVLVNSTGQGTLGRVARWTGHVRATVDSHITILRFNDDQVDPVTAGMSVLGIQDAIVEMGEGSTGQTELSRTELGKLKVRLPKREQQGTLGLRFSELSRLEFAVLAENQTLAATRDALLPQLMSGKLRVKEAEALVSSAV